MVAATDGVEGLDGSEEISRDELCSLVDQLKDRRKPYVNLGMQGQARVEARKLVVVPGKMRVGRSYRPDPKLSDPFRRTLFYHPL